jgi:hypothetical protein
MINRRGYMEDEDRRTLITNTMFQNWEQAANFAARAPENTEEGLGDLAVAVLMVGVEVCFHLEAIKEELRGLRLDMRK